MERKKKLLRQTAAFVFITLPLSSLHLIRNFILFNQGPGFLPDTPLPQLPNTIYNFVNIPFYNLFKNPFINAPDIDNWSAIGLFYTEYVLKSSLFGEWLYPGLEGTAVLLIAFSLIGICLVVSYFFVIRIEGIGKADALFFLNLIIPLLLHFYSRTKVSVFCVQDFRYRAPTLISAAYFHGQAVDYFYYHGRPWLKVFAFTAAVIFYLCSILFILGIGM